MPRTTWAPAARRTRRSPASASDHPLSLHGVCMSIGGPQPLDREHLGALQGARRALRAGAGFRASRLVDARDDLLQRPAAAAVHAAPRLRASPTTSTRCRTRSAGRSCSRTRRPTSCFRNSTMSETDFLRELVRRTGCGLLLDVNNVFVSATNHGYAALDYLADFPLEHVGEIHLAGHEAQADDEGDLLLIDSHDGPVPDAVWTLYDSVIGRCGAGADAGRMGQRHPRLAGAQGRGCRRPGDPRPPRTSRSQGQDPCRRLNGLHRPAYAEAFAAALLDPDRAVPDVVAGPRGKAATRRYGVYRNNVTVSLIDALAAVYPATQRITGPDFFRAMARFHVRAHSADFPAPLRIRPRVSGLHRGLRACAADAVAGGRGADRARLARRLPRRRCRAVGAAAARIHCTGPARRNRTVPASRDQDRALALSGGQHLCGEPRRGPGGPHHGDRARGRADHPTGARGRRPKSSTRRCGLPDAPWQGRALGTAAAAALEASPAFDLGANIAGMLHAGAFTAIDQGSR